MATRQGTSPRRVHIPGAEASEDGQDVAATRDRLRRLILSGELAAGAVVTQGRLAQALGIGVTPLREALRMLQQEGLIVSAPNRRVRVAELAPGDLEEIFIVLISLQTGAARISIPSLSAHDVADLKALLAKMDHYLELELWSDWQDVHRDFHAGLVAGAGTRVTGLIEQALDHASRYIRQLPVRHLSDGSTARQAEHQAILEAAERRDPDEVAAALTLHHARAAEAALHDLDPRFVPARLEAAVAGLTRGLSAR